MPRILVTILLGASALAAASARAQTTGTICGGVFTAGGGTVVATDGHELSSALGEPIAGAPEPTPAAPGIIKTGFLYRECSGSIVVGVPPTRGEAALRTWLEEGHPNPFNPRTTIRFQLAAAGDATLELYDGAGRKARLLLDARLDAGQHAYVLDATGLSSGVYYVRLVTASEKHVRSIVLVK